MNKEERMNKFLIEHPNLRNTLIMYAVPKAKVINPNKGKRRVKKIKEMGGRERTRFLVRKRDNFTCQDCGDRRTPEQALKMESRSFDVHHLNGLCGKRSRKYDRVEDMGGLITLCHKCHFNRPEHRTKSKVFQNNAIKHSKLTKSYTVLEQY